MTARQPPDETALRLFGNTVHMLRRNAGLRQEDLAHLAGLSRAHIGQIENGASNVTLDTILRLAVAFDVTPSELLEPLNARPDLYPIPKNS